MRWLCDSAWCLTAAREIRLLRRSRAARGGAVLLFAIAWLPPLLIPLRSGELAVAALADVAPLALAVAGVILPLLALVAGADVLAGEIEDGTLVPVVTLPISRAACYAGKLVGRLTMLGFAYVAAFGSAGAVMALAHGVEGWIDLTAVAATGLLLCVVCVTLGSAIAARGRGRMRTYAATLVVWLVLVFVVDTVLLAGIVASAPAPPAHVGQHGHDELALTERADRGRVSSPDERESGGLPSASLWLMALNPVDVYRLTAVAAGPGLRDRLGPAAPGQSGALWLPLVTGWMVWLVGPPALGLARFRRVALR